MYVKYVLIALVFALAGCQNKPSDATETTDGESEQKENEASSATGEKAKSSGFWQPLVMHPFTDNQGTVTAVMPLPSDWEVAAQRVTGQPGITGPHGITVTDFALQSFMYTNDPHMQQIYYQSGQQLRAMPGAEQIIQQDIVPWAAQRGLQLVNQYEIPEVTKTDKWYNDQLYRAVPGQNEVMAIGTDWKAEDGTPYFLLVHLNMSTTAQLQMWYYTCTGLQAETKYFEAAKKQLLFSIVNTHYPLEPIMAYNQREAEKAGKSWAAHNQRMAQNQANFEASQRAHVNKSNAINDAIMSGWRERNAASDKQHEQFVDVITERTNVIDPSTGQRYKVASGANQYWMNSNGEYMSTNLHNYNPNLDDGMNQQHWQQLQEVK